ncbi:MAG: RnfABCDGE type electron transport complex subunit B [Eubacteriales bacterium]|nr:RnfABCDGE type electron transport complex subunit B [Eubacteriales bacterium]
MDFTLVLIAAGLITGVGLLVGLFLGFSAIKFEVPVDEREIKIREALPGANCGACGYPGCDGLAHAIVIDEAPVSGCPVGGADCAMAIGKIMGQSGSFEKTVAFVKCGGTCNRAGDKFIYSGIHDCNAAVVVPGGSPKQCGYGCMGLGSCVAACEYDAIHIVDGIAKVDPEKCVACKACVVACPKELIEIIPYTAKQVVRCMSKDKAKDVKVACEVGCIACKRCVKVCPFDAIHVNDMLAKVDYDKCKRCRKCAKACPQNTITFKLEDTDFWNPPQVEEEKETA